MPFPATWRVEVTGENTGDEIWSNVLHFRIDPSDRILDQTSANELGNHVNDAYLEVVSEWHDECAITKIVVRDVRVLNGAAFEVVPVNYAGPGLDTTPLPPQLAMVVSLRTSVFSRRGRGRIYIAGIGAGNLEGTGRLALASQTDLADFITALMTPATPGEFTLAVASEVDQVSRAVTHAIIDNVFDTQRRRRDQFDSTSTLVRNAP